MSPDDSAILDVLGAARLAVEFRAGFDRAAFLADLKTQSAVLHQLVLLGEAVRRLSEEFRAAHPAVPWHRIIGMRNRLIHEYDRVDLEQVWETVTTHVPDLIAELEPVEPRGSDPG